MLTAHDNISHPTAVGIAMKIIPIHMVTPTSTQNPSYPVSEPSRSFMYATRSVAYSVYSPNTIPVSNAKPTSHAVTGFTIVLFDRVGTSIKVVFCKDLYGINCSRGADNLVR